MAGTLKSNLHKLRNYLFECNPVKKILMIIYYIISKCHCSVTLEYGHFVELVLNFRKYQKLWLLLVKTKAHKILQDGICWKYFGDIILIFSLFILESSEIKLKIFYAEGILVVLFDELWLQLVLKLNFVSND